MKKSWSVYLDELNNLSSNEYNIVTHKKILRLKTL